MRSVSVVERPLEEAEGEPAGLELGLAEQAIGDEQERRRAVACGSRCGSRAATAARSGQRTPWIGPMPGRDALLAVEVLRVGEAGEAARQGAPRTRPDRWSSRRAMRRAPRPARGGRRRTRRRAR